MTNSIWTLSEADQIVMLENGSILEMGTYEELVARKGAFFYYLDKHKHDDEENDESEEEEEKEIKK